MPEAPPHPDIALARRAASGDEGAWNEIYRGSREKLFALLVYQIGNRDEALDVMQETYMHAVKGMSAYRGQGSLESWMCGIALRRARDWKRRLLGKFKRTDSLGGAVDGVVPALISSHADPEEARRLQRAIDTLPDRQRSCFLLHEHMGYGFREVGEVLSIGEATARVHAHRARAALRELLTETPTSAPTAAMLEERS
jgi:RNA polymerase sigma-70 factor (ECF subfamily)